MSYLPTSLPLPLPLPSNNTQHRSDTPLPLPSIEPLTTLPSERGNSQRGEGERENRSKRIGCVPQGWRRRRMSDDDGDASRTFFTPHFFKRLRYGTLHPQTRSTGLLEIIACTITESPQARIPKPRPGAGLLLLLLLLSHLPPAQWSRFVNPSLLQRRL